MIHDAARSGSIPSNCLLLTVCAALLSALAGCATLPPEGARRALYVDARKALSAENRLGWTVDRVEVEDAAAQAEQSACQVAPADRAALRAWVDERIGALGGSAIDQFRAGVDRDDLDEVIDLERTRALLDHVALHVPSDCPFWLTPHADFSGVNTSAHRFVLLAESMGGGSISISHGKARAGAGGAARLFGSYGTSARTQLALGLEAGGDAVLQEGDDGALEPEGAFRFGVPVLARLVDLDRIYDVELAAVTALTHGTFKPWGGRIGVAGGVAGLRRLGFMPALQVWLGYELYPAQDGQPARHVVRLGTRVGFDWDP